MKEVTLFGYSISELLPVKSIYEQESRLYWPFLLLCALYAGVYLLFFHEKKYRIDLKSWISKSACVDYSLWAINHAIQLLILPTSFGSGMVAALWFRRFLIFSLGHSTFAFYSGYVSIAIYTLLLILANDFARYMLHYALHTHPFLRAIHRTHHTAEVLTPITLFRVHPLEMILSQGRYLFVYSTLTGTYLYLYHDLDNVPTIFGVGLGVFLSNVLAANLRHSNIPVGFGIWERIFISPKQHQMHHAVQFASGRVNMGSMFSFWDRLFGTWKPSQDVEIQKFGISNAPQSQSLLTELVFPLRYKNIYKHRSQRQN